MSIKDQLNSLGWSIKNEFFEDVKGRIDDVKKQLLNVSEFIYLNLLVLISS